MKIRWKWCTLCECPTLDCPQKDCDGTVCNGGGCDWCVKHIHPKVDAMYKDGTIPSPQQVDEGVYFECTALR